MRDTFKPTMRDNSCILILVFHVIDFDSIYEDGMISPAQKPDAMREKLNEAYQAAYSLCSYS